MAQTQTVEKPNFDTVWAALQEVAAMQRETDFTCAVFEDNLQYKMEIENAGF